MWELYSYTALLLIVFMVTLYILFNLMRMPLKIRISGVILVILLIMRYSSLLVMLVSENIKHLYILEPFYFSNMIYIPTVIFVLFYIFLRHDKLNFSYIFVICGIFFVLYYTLVVMATPYICPSKFSGYVMKLGDKQMAEWGYIILNTIIFYASLMLSKKKNTIKSGMFLMAAASFVSVAEVIASFMGVSIYPDFVISDFLWVMSLLYGFCKVIK